MPSSGHITGPGAMAFTRTCGPELARQRFGEHDEPGLGHAVHRVAAKRAQAVNIRDVQDQALR